MSPSEKGQFFLAQLRQAVAADLAARPPSPAEWERSLQAMGESLVDVEMLPAQEVLSRPNPA